MSILRTGSTGLEQQHSYKKWSSSEHSVNDVIACYQSISYFHKTRKSFAFYEGHVIFCSTSQKPLVAQGLLLFIVFSRSHSDAPQSVGLLWTWHQPETSPYMTIHNTHKSQTSMAPSRFEPTTPASERPQVVSLNRVATGIALKKFHNMYFSQNIIRQPNQEGQDGWVVQQALSDDMCMHTLSSETSRDQEHNDLCLAGCGAVLISRSVIRFGGDCSLHLQDQCGPRRYCFGDLSVDDRILKLLLRKKTVRVWLLSVQDMIHWPPASNMVINPHIPHKTRKCLHGLRSYQFINKTLLSTVGKKLSVCYFYLRTPSTLFEILQLIWQWKIRIKVQG